MVLGVDRALHIVANSVGAVTERRHRAGIRICQGDLVLTRRDELRFQSRQHLHFSSEDLDAAIQGCEFFGEHGYAGHLGLAIRAIEIGQVASDGLLNRLLALLQSTMREVLLAVVHRLELAAVDRNSRLVQKMHASA